MPKTDVFGHILASAQFGPDNQNAENECFWAHLGFRPIWSKPGANHPTGRHPPTHLPGATHPPTHTGATHPPGRHPPTHPPGRHPPTRAPPIHPATRAPPTHPPTHPGTCHPTARMPETKVFGHIRASAQFSPNSQNAEYQCFWAHSGFRLSWSKQPEGRKGMFLGTFVLSAQFGPKRAPPTHPSTQAPPTHPASRAPPSEQPECRKQMFLGTFWLQPNLVRTTRMPKTNGCGHIWASGQFGPNRAPTIQPGATHPPTSRAPPTHPPTRAPPIHPGATHPPTHPGATHPPGRHPSTQPPGRHPPTHPPTRAPAIQQPECQKPRFLGTFEPRPNLVRTARMPNTNVFGHIRASG